MRKKLIIDLKNLAQDILQLKEEIEVDLLRQKSQEIFEKLLVLDYLNKNNISSIKDKAADIILKNDASIIENENKENFIRGEANSDITFNLKKEIDLSINSLETEEFETKIEEEPIVKKEEIVKKLEDIDDIFVPTFDAIKEDLSQKEEFKDTVSLDETENLFATKKEKPNQLSLNDKLLSSSIQVGLNDRIAFVNKLFNFSQSEFNKELSILNTFDSEIEAKNYIQNILKAKYNWKNKEEIVDRFMLLVERKFL